jgi:hypothetical protein
MTNSDLIVAHRRRPALVSNSKHEREQQDRIIREHRSRFLKTPSFTSSLGPNRAVERSMFLGDRQARTGVINTAEI